MVVDVDQVVPGIVTPCAYGGGMVRLCGELTPEVGAVVTGELVFTYPTGHKLQPEPPAARHRQAQASTSPPPDRSTNGAGDQHGSGNGQGNRYGNGAGSRHGERSGNGEGPVQEQGQGYLRNRAN
jgi:hypothetical protein